MTLTATERARWDADGYLVRRDVLAPDEVVRLREAAEDVVARVIATAIVFLDDASVENGAIRVLPGSHRDGPARRDPDDPTGFLADPAHIDAGCEVAIEVPAGSMLLLSSLLLHRSSPNTSSDQRRALLLSFQPAGRPRQVELDWRPERVRELP
jgi:ectoine hydroxylase-related dioxygenase (phytanoyl-CoA dioxygenase family)